MLASDFTSREAKPKAQRFSCILTKSAAVSLVVPPLTTNVKNYSSPQDQSTFSVTRLTALRQTTLVLRASTRPIAPKHRPSLRPDGPLPSFYQCCFLVSTVFSLISCIKTHRPLLLLWFRALNLETVLAKGRSIRYLPKDPLQREEATLSAQRPLAKGRNDVICPKTPCKGKK